jgi:hypothetical protein
MSVIECFAGGPVLGAFCMLTLEMKRTNIPPMLSGEIQTPFESARNGYSCTSESLSY